MTKTHFLSVASLAAICCLQLLIPMRGRAYLSPEDVFGGGSLSQASSEASIPIPFIPQSSSAGYIPIPFIPQSSSAGYIPIPFIPTSSQASSQATSTGGTGGNGGEDGGGNTWHNHQAAGRSAERLTTPRVNPAPVGGPAQIWSPIDAVQGATQLPATQIQPQPQAQGQHPSPAVTPSPQGGSSVVDPSVQEQWGTLPSSIPGSEDASNSQNPAPFQRKPPYVPSTGLGTTLSVTVLVFTALLTIVIAMMRAHRLYGVR